MPLDEVKLSHITDTAFEILERIGVSGAPDDIRTLALENGATERDDGRITFSRDLVEDMIAKSFAGLDRVICGS